MSYNQDDSHVKMNRFKNIGMGLDPKSNARLIKDCPGPADYNTINPNDSAVFKASFNYFLMHGGLQRRKTSVQEIENLQVRTFAKPAKQAQSSAIAILSSRKI